MTSLGCGSSGCVGVVVMFRSCCVIVTIGCVVVVVGLAASVLC